MKKTKIFENFGLKVLAVVIAILLWLVVVNVSDPVINTPYSDIPVVVKNTDVVTGQGKVYELTSGETVTISVNAKRSILDYLSEDNFKAVVDLEEYDEETGMVPIKVESNKYGDKIESMKSKTEYATVDIEDMLRKQFLITPIVSGEPEAGYVIGDVTTAENIVRVSGAQSVVSAIKKVTAEVSVAGLSSNINTSVDLRFYDEDDNQIDTGNLTQNISTVGVSAQILATKELPLRFSVGGIPKENYCVSGELTADRDVVLVAGRNSLLSSMSALEIPATAVSVEGADEDVSVTVDIARYLPDGLRLVDEKDVKDVTVKVPVDAVVNKKFWAACSSIRMQGLPDNVEAGFVRKDENIEVEISGTAEAIKEFTIESAEFSVDWTYYMKEQRLETLAEGDYRMPVTVRLPEKLSLSKEIYINIRIAEREE